MAKSGAMHLAWRNGRPRWMPSEPVRNLGFKGRDLKDADGHWLGLREARAAAEELNVEVARCRMGLTPVPATRPLLVEGSGPAAGYVYFLWVDAFVKIGFSVDPFNRAQQLKTGLPGKIRRLCAIPGSTIDERRLHRVFADSRSQGEWFHNTAAIERALMSFVMDGRISLIRNRSTLTPFIADQSQHIEAAE